MSVILSSVTKASAQVIFGERNIEPQGYNGSEANITTPDPVTFYPPDRAAGVTGVGQRNGIFIEAGGAKDCSLDCGYYPHVAYRDASGNGATLTYSAFRLNPNGFYIYKTSYAGNGSWKAEWCTSSGCRTLATANLGWKQSLPTVYAGGRLDSFYTRLGYVTLDSNIFILGYTSNSRYVWCYTNTNITTDRSSISQCAAGYGNWQVARPVTP